MAADLWPKTRVTAQDFADLARMTRLLESHPWVFAKTMKYNPHWYSLRQAWADYDGDFVFVVEQIRRFGYYQRYGTRWFACHDVGEHFYWTMGNPTLLVADIGWEELKGTRLINRKPITAKPEPPKPGRAVKWGFGDDVSTLKVSAALPKLMPHEFARTVSRALPHAVQHSDGYRRIDGEAIPLQVPGLQALYQHDWLAAVSAARHRPMRCVTNGVAIHYLERDAALVGGADGWTSLLATADTQFGGGRIVAGDLTFEGPGLERIVAVTGPFGLGGVSFGLRAVVEARYREAES